MYEVSFMRLEKVLPRTNHLHLWSLWWNIRRTTVLCRASIFQSRGYWMIIVHPPFYGGQNVLTGCHDSLDDTQTYPIISKDKEAVLSLYLMIERTSMDSSGELDYTVSSTLRKSWNNNEKADSQAQDARSPIRDFRVLKNLTFKTRLSAKSLLWKWVLFAS